LEDGDLRCYRAKAIFKPDIDWLAENGLRFTMQIAPHLALLLPGFQYFWTRLPVEKSNEYFTWKCRVYL
jgi:hypothetical protein